MLASVLHIIDSPFVEVTHINHSFIISHSYTTPAETILLSRHRLYNLGYFWNFKKKIIHSVLYQLSSYSMQGTLRSARTKRWIKQVFVLMESQLGEEPKTSEEKFDWGWEGARIWNGRIEIRMKEGWEFQPDLLRLLEQETYNFFFL